MWPPNRIMILCILTLAVSAAFGCSDDLQHSDPWGFSESTTMTPTPPSSDCEGLTSEEQSCLETLTMAEARTGMTEEFISDHVTGNVRSEVLARWAALELTSDVVRFEVICRESPEECNGASIHYGQVRGSTKVELTFDGWQWTPKSGTVDMSVTQVNDSTYKIEVTIEDLLLENPDPDSPTRRVIIPKFVGHMQARFEYERLEGRDF
jgi:hypothetical protein